MRQSIPIVCWHLFQAALAGTLTPPSTSSADTMEFHCKSTRTARLHHSPRTDFDRSASRIAALQTTTNRPTDCSVNPVNYRKFHPEWMETFQIEFYWLSKASNYYFYNLRCHVVGRPAKWIYMEVQEKRKMINEDKWRISRWGGCMMNIPAVLSKYISSLHIPKSAIRTWPSWSSSTLSSFKSLL